MGAMTDYLRDEGQASKMWNAPVNLHAGIDTIPGPDASGRAVLSKELDVKPVL